MKLREDVLIMEFIRELDIEALREIETELVSLGSAVGLLGMIRAEIGNREFLMTLGD